MSRSSFRKSAKNGLLVLLVFLAIGGALLVNYSIDEEVTVGDGYGFVVGERMTAVAEKIRSQPSPPDWPIAICAYGDSQYKPVDADQFDDLTAIECEYVILVKKRYDVARDGLRLEISDERLASIYRYRKVFELP